MAHFVTGLQPALMESAHRSPHQGHSTPSHQGHFPPAHQGHHPPSHTPHPPKPKPPTSIELHHVQAPSETDGNTAFLRAARAGHLDKVLEHLKTNIDINTSNANGLNALHLASKDGHVNVVTELLKRGASVDAATKKGNTALHIASLAGQEEVVKLLVQHGAAVNVQSQNGFTPLYMAAQENHDNVVRFLLANGANQSLATEDGFTPLAVAMQQGHDKVVAVLLESDTRGKVRLPALHIAAKKDDCKAAALLLQNEHNPDVTSKSGFTPLHIAAHYGNENIANLLLQKGADVNYSAKHNITPLHVAAKWGKSNMVALLLEKGGNIESKTRDGLTPLHCAARSGHEQVVDMLLERGAPISSKTKNGLAPLHMASQGDHVDAARILLYHRAPVDEVTVDYLTALHVAAHCGHVRVAKLLLDRKADPDARALNGFTPLHIACKKNRIKVVELLLKHGASIEATTESGLTPLHVASFMGCMNIVIFLLQHNANPDVPTVRGETPLHLAARANQTDIIRILLRNGAQVDARAREQQTPLHIASRLGNVDIVMLLLQHGAQIDATTKDMYTALHIAAKEGQEEVASVLLEHGAALTATTKKGFTPLHLAAKYGNIKVAQLLLQRDAPVDAQGKNGVTPLHVASHYDHQNVALLLLDKGASPHATAKNGHTPLHIAARKNQMDIATTLLEYGAKADAESKAGFTPLHLSAQEGHTDMTNLLIEHHAEPDHKAKNGLTPLHLCSQEDKPNVAAILIKNNAEVDATTKAGYTPLHVASHFGQVNTVRFLLEQGADVKKCTSIGYTPLHQAAQQGHATIVQLLLDNGASPNAQTSQGQTALSIAQKLGYISVVEALKGVTTDQGSSQLDEKYRVVAPETMQEIFMSDSEDENGEDTMLSDQPYRYLTVDEMKSLGDDSLPIDVTRDERIDSNKEAFGPGAGEDVISPQHAKEHYAHFANLTPDNVDISRHPINVGKLQWRNFLVSFLVDARGGAMRGCRHSGVRVIIPPRKATMPMRVTCRYLKRDKLIHPPPLMEGEALASRVLELGPVGAKFLGPVIIEVPHFASLRGSEREIVILRSDNGETWREHTMEASDEVVHDVLNESFDGEELSQIEDLSSGRITRILTNDFPQYFAIVSRIRQEVHPIGPDGGMVSSSVVPQVQAVFPQGALTKKIKVGLQAQPISAELTAKLLGNRVAVSPIVTVEPRRRKFHKPITLTIPVPRAANKGMINQYSGDAPTLRLLCSITGGTSRAQWEDVTGSTPLTFVNDCVSFTTTVSARFWLMDCRNIAEATKMATELYREAIHVPFMAKFVVFAKRVDVLEARLRVFCMTDDREDKTLEHQEHFTEVAKSRDVEVLEGKAQYVEFAGNLVPVTKSGDQLRLGFKAFRENRLPFTVRVKDPHVDSVGRLLFMREAKVGKGDPPQQPICCLNIVLPETIMPDSALSEPDLFALQKKISSMRDSGIEAQRTDLRLSDISNLLGYDWVNLAPHLGIQESDISLIKTESPANVAQQARAMLRLWLYLQGNKASGKSLETALNRINRSDIAEQCIFNEQIKSKTSASKDVMGITRTEAFDERDIMKVSESVEDLMQSDVRGKIKADERDEKKYLAEEKDVEEEEQKTVKEIKQEIERRLSQEKQYSETQRRSLSISDEKLAKPKQPQRHSVAADFVHTEIKAEEISKPEKGISEKEEEPEKPISVKEKISQFQKISSQDESSKATKTTEIETQIERKHQTVQEIMESESKKISDEIKGDSTKMTKTTENIIISQKEDTTKVVEEKVAEKTKDIINQEEKLLDDLGKKKDVAEEQTTFLIHEQASEEHRRRDSELLEGVTESLGKLGKIEEPSKDLLSPKVSKTPPPSPADFLNRGSPPSATTTWTQPQTTEPTATQLEYSEKGQSEEYVRETQESYRGSHGQGKHEESIKYPDTKKSSKTPDVSTNIKTSPLESVNISDDISPVTQNLGIVDPLKVGSSPSETQQTSEFGSDEVQSYGDRKKFWEQMSSSHSSEGSEHRRSFHESVSRDSFEIDKRSLTSEKETESSIEEEHISVKSAREKFERQEKDSKSLDTTEKRKSTEEGGLVKSLTESFSEKIFAGELVMPAAPRPKSGTYRDVIEGEEGATTPEAAYLKKQIVEGSSGTQEVSELEAELARRRAGAPITDETVISGSTGLGEEEKGNVEFSIGTTVIIKDKTERKFTQGASTDSEAEFISKYGEESVAFENSAFLEDDDDENIPLSERKKVFQENLNKRPPPIVPIRTSLYERSMSLPPQDLPEIPGIRDKKRYFENQLQKEIVVEQLMTQQDEECSTEYKSIADCRKPWKPEEHKKIFGDKLEEKVETSEEAEVESRKSWKEEADKEKERTQSLIQEKRKSIEVKETAVKVVNELIKEGAKAVEEKLIEKEQEIVIPQESELSSTAEEVIHYKSDNLSKPSDSLEVHVDKSEIEENEKEKDVDEVLSAMDKREDGVPSITITHSGKRQTETSSIGESEDTQSESDVTPEDARVVDNGAVPWESGGNSPKDDVDIGQTGMGRWVGQEDLSKETWEKDDIDSRVYQIEPKWERTRSEGASPKEQFVYTPEEHYPDTVWEVPVQEQLETEEITQDIPIEKQVIIEKDEEEEEEEEEEEVRDIRDTELTEEEAREIAEEILDYIQFEVENRSSLLITDLSGDSDKHPSDVPHPQVSDYLRQLAGEKNLDDREVELIESVLVQKHREQILKLRNNETTSSQEITDEDLRSSGVETDLSPLDSQAGKLQILGEEEIDSMETSEGIIESRLEELDEKSIKEEMEDFGTKEEEKVEKKLKDEDIVEQTIAEVKESLEAAQEELIEQHKKKRKEEIFKKESPSEFEFKGISYEKSIDDKIEEIYYEETEGTTEYETVEDGQKIVGRSDIKAKDQFEFQESDKARIAKQEFYTDHGKIEHKTEGISQSQKQIHDITVSETTTEESEKEFLQKKISAEISDEDEKSIQSKKSATHFYDEERGLDISQKSEDIKSTQSSQLEEKYEDVIFKKMGDSEHYQTKVLITKSSEEATEQKTYEQLSELEITPESTISKKFDAQRTSMEDSPKSASQEESMKSPLGAEEYHSSSSSIGKHDELLKSDKSGIVLRHSSSSGTGGLPKGDRRSGTDLEPYSSSGESHYHSLDQSRPCSSDVEALLAGGVGTGSSEYESALSQELSSRQTTSGEYVTAVSSLSSRESIKSLDSESSGHLASIEVSSEASETLIPSALELDRDFDSTGAILLDDDSPEMLGGRKAGSRPPPYVTQMSAPATANRGSVDEDFEVISESEVVSWTGEVSEDEATEAVAPDGEEQAENGEKLSKLKRSHEMTFQPEPRPIESAGSLETSPGDIIIDKNIYGSSMDETASMISMQDERFGSLEETGSVLSMSLSTASEASAVRTVIELSRTDSEKMDGSLTVSVASADSGSREELDNLTSSTIQPQTNEMSTSTPTSSSGRKTASVTITTSAVDEHGISSVSTQVTSVSRKSSMADDQKSEEDVSHANGPTQVDYVPEYDEVETTKSKKTHGHRRKESTSNFVPTMQWTVGETKSKKEVKVEMGGFEERTESDKYVYDVTLTEKEVKNDEKKESDDCEKPDDESYDTEADQGFHQDLREGRIYEDEGTEDDYREIDGSRPQSQISKTDSESGRRPQSILSEDQPDSELSELMKQGSSDREDPIERPASPEPEELENKDDTPEFSSEAQASVTELEMEYSGAYSRRDEYASHVSPVREEKFEHEKIKEAEAAFSAVPHTIPHMRSSLPEAIIENPIAEKHELEEREKESLRRKVTEIPTSPGDIPDITVTQHMTPLLDRSFHYPDLELEAEERKLTQLEETPELMEKDEYEEEKILQEDVQPELPLSKIEKETKVQQKESESLDSPNSDSFEMLDKPDISDEYVIIEEVGKEAEEHDQEGKGVTIAAKKRKITKKGEEDEKDELISSPPAPATKLTELKYFPGDEDVGPFPFDSDSPPIATDKQADKLRERISKEEEEENEYEQQLEESKKWIEMQFQGEQAAKVMGGYGYEIEYERGPLEDIKEEEIGELDSSSKIGSMGSQKESLGSFGSVKDSFSSTPDYDVLAGRKYFTRSGDHDDVSMSSLQEFELLEKKILMENGKKSGSSSSQDSLSSKKLGTSNKSGQGDDLSLASLREFEILENACVTVVKIEHKAKEEEAMLSEIDEGHESQVSESESCETVSGVIKDKPESDSEDFDKRMFEIDEIIKQAQSNVEKFTDLRGLDKTESVGRGDSFEEVAKVPDLELDAPLHGKSLYESDVSLHGAGKSSYSTQVVTKKKVQKWREEDELKKSESLEIQSKILSISTDSLEVKGDKIMTTSTDSLELEQEKKKKGDIMTDSIEMQADTMSIDSFDLQLAQKPADTFSIDSFDAQFKSGEKILTDSMEEDESFKGRGHESSSSGRDGEYSSSGREDSETYSRRAPPRSDYMLGSTDSLDPTSSTATHATYQYETDSVMSSSFTSGGSNTMVSSTDNLDLTLTGKTGLEGIDISNAATRTGIWFESLKEGGEPIVSEIFEPLEGDKYSHTIHRTVEMAPEIRKVVFKGPDAEKALKEYVEGFAPGEDVIEVQEKDEHGNIHVKRIVKRKMVVRPEDFGGKQPTEDELEAYLRKFEKEGFDSKQEFVTEEFGDDFTSSYPSQSFGQSQTTAYSSDKKLTGKEEGQSSTSKDESGKEASATEKEADEGEIDEQLDAALASSFSPHK